MKVFVVVVVLVLFLGAGVESVCGEPFCDLALESGKFIDWLVCMVFAMIIGDGVGDWQGNLYHVG